MESVFTDVFEVAGEVAVDVVSQRDGVGECGGGFGRACGGVVVVGEGGFELGAEGPACAEVGGERCDDAEPVGVVGDVVVARGEDDIGDEAEGGGLFGLVHVVAPEVDLDAEADVAHAGFGAGVGGVDVLEGIDEELEVDAVGEADLEVDGGDAEACGLGAVFAVEAQFGEAGFELERRRRRRLGSRWRRGGRRRGGASVRVGLD